MFFRRTLHSRAELTALDRSQAVIRFDMKGGITDANDNFLRTMGYSRDEVIGKNHSMFVEPEYATGDAYREFWDKLQGGEFQAAQFRRIAKGGRQVWIEASYNPILDKNGRPIGVVKYATNITDRQLSSAVYAGKLAAISKSQATIEFNLDGTIISANENFLEAMGYTLDEIADRHHRIFVDPEYAGSNEYRQFWEKLGRGEFDAGQYRRFGKEGREIWIQASYNPIFDMNGKPFMVVKYATDITRQKLDAANSAGQLDAISKSQAVIEFDLDGTITAANANFLNAMGYSLAEVKGQHHRMFVEPAYANSEEYGRFWEKTAPGGVRGEGL